jgi:D-serine deaminase-like pyridoxal phosphate-dependent protein
LADDSPFDGAAKWLKRAVRQRSIRDGAQRRAELSERLRREGIVLDFVNGGGTGSVFSTTREDVVTEVTVGSGFYCPHLFSYYRGLALSPAAFFALQVVRRPRPEMVTCLGGGYIASGGAGRDRLPIVHFPSGATLTEREGAGEVQTPVRLPPGGPNIALGDPIIFRHAKAGELMEHFTEVLLVREGRIVDRVPTYRGQGKAFL